MVNWKDQASKDRLLAAVIASVTSKGGKINYYEVARLYGQGATYDAVEGQLRVHKKLAKDLNDTAPAKVATPTKGGSPKKEFHKDAVKSGSIVKKSRKSATAAANTFKTLLDTDLSAGGEDGEDHYGASIF